MPYKDVFTLELPFSPPPELRGNLGGDQERELARLFAAPKVMHKLRLANTSKYPLTTAPALISREGRLLAQGMMTYTATGASADLPVTTAVDFQVRKSDAETKRTPNAAQQNGASFSRIDLAGKITLIGSRDGEFRLKPQPSGRSFYRLRRSGAARTTTVRTAGKPRRNRRGAS
jgi:hypothetical protein